MVKDDLNHGNIYESINQEIQNAMENIKEEHETPLENNMNESTELVQIKKIETHDLKDGEIVYTCEQCNFKANDGSSLQKHRESIHERATFSCDQCSYQFLTNDKLKAHEKIYHECDYSCNKCDKTFCFQSDLKWHLQIIHFPISGVVNKS